MNVWSWFNQNKGMQMNEEVYGQIFGLLGYSNVRVLFLNIENVKIFGLFKLEELDFL